MYRIDKIEHTLKRSTLTINVTDLPPFNVRSNKKHPRGFLFRRLHCTFRSL